MPTEPKSGHPLVPTLDDPLRDAPPAAPAPLTGYEETLEEAAACASARTPRGRRGSRAPAPEGSHDGLGAHQGALAGTADRAVPELGPEPRRRVARHRHPRIDGRDVAVYGHDFTVRAGSMDATNGAQARAPDLPGGRAGHPADRHERLRRRLRARRRRRSRRLCRGVHGAAQDQRRRAQHHVHVRLQRRRRLLSAAPGQLRDPAATTPSSA